MRDVAEELAEVLAEREWSDELPREPLEPDPPEPEPDPTGGNHEAPGHAEEPRQHGSWWPVDLAPVLDGIWRPPEPTVGKRSDGRGLFYPAKSHTVIGETESAKTWFALSAVLDELASGEHVLFIDFEDDEGSVVNRLLTISGHAKTMIRERFHYLRPEGDLRARANREDLAELLHTYRPTLAINDGITEAMAMHNLNPIDNADVAIFNAILVKPTVTLGAAVASLDHVKKSSDDRGRYALGGVHKLNAVSGAGYLLENRMPFGVGLTGRSTIKITKDRPGQLRPHGVPSSSGLYWYGDLVLESHDRDFGEVSVEPPHERVQEFRPTALMKQISDLLAAKGPLSKNKIETAIRGKTEYKRQALTLLIIDGYVSDRDARHPHELLRPFEEDE
jgi:AAA domain